MTVVYDKFDWQIEKKIQSELVIKHFRLILEWLDNKGLLSDRGKELLVSGLDCNVSLSSNMVTDKGDSFLSKYYGEYKEAISDGKDEKACLQLLVFCNI